MGTNESDEVNDLDGPHDPSFVSVAICIGTDLDSKPVTLVDRLCINRPGVELIAGDMSICQQELKAFRSEATEMQHRLEAESARSTVAGAALLIVCVFAAARSLTKLARKS